MQCAAQRASWCRLTPLVDDLDRRSRSNGIEEFDHVGISHPDAAVRRWGANGCLVWRAVDVDVTAHAVRIAESILAAFETPEPEDPRRNPVPSGVCSQHLGSTDFPRRAPPNKDRTHRCAGSDLCPDLMQPARCLLTTFALAGALRSCRDRVGCQDSIAFKKLERLGAQIYANPSSCHAPDRTLSVRAAQAAEADGRGLQPIVRLQPDTVRGSIIGGRSLEPEKKSSPDTSYSREMRKSALRLSWGRG